MRKQGWEKALDTYILSVCEKDFSWGECDCLLFVSDAAFLLSGIDPMSKKNDGDPDTIRGKYSTEEGAFKLIKRLRGSVPNIMDIHFPRVPTGFAQRGDIVLGKITNTYCFGLVGTKSALFKTQDRGLLPIPVNNCKIAWRV